LEAALLESDMRGIAWFEERKTHQATRQLLTRIYTTFVDEMRTIHEQDPQIREKVTDSLHKAFGKHIVKEENIKAPEEGPLKKDSRASEWVYGIESQLCDKFPDCLCSSFDDSLEFE
jgi:iron-sulfur cluster repair protein YtfE (RIC family)